MTATQPTQPTRVEHLDPAHFDLNQQYPIRHYVAHGIGSDATFRRHLRSGALPHEWDRGRMVMFPADVMRALHPRQNPSNDELQAWVEAKAAEAPPITSEQAELAARVMGAALRQRVAELGGATG
ncbi:hypothetical protein G7085_08950 [Tessaracoccus sp. HDW20]|uniref:hypothetical protein n=1 Tax=Tessaracoccus coleopterorum TaxID=2714950 RepID=UPI0018D47778|nr:hypothetical protein [Tessaracoccus coleopterorum]NHB84694.1 hypothetical protein [Tessaracoccus coleopterorum]